MQMNLPAYPNNVSNIWDIWLKKPKKQNNKTTEAALDVWDSWFVGKNSMYVMSSFFFSIETKKPSVLTAVPSNEENEGMPSGQGGSQEIRSPNPNLWYCTV